MSDTSANLLMPYLAAAQAQKHVTVNEALRKLDCVVQLAVESATTPAQPGAPSDGRAWIVPAGKTGAQWASFANWAIGYYRDGAWEQLTPRQGWLAYVRDQDLLYLFNGALWTPHNGVGSGPCDGRLTLATGVAVLSADVSAATSVYFTPYRGNQVALYDGAAWRLVSFTEKTIKLTDAQTGTTTNGSAVVTGLTDASQLIVGMKVSGAGVAGGATILSIDSATQITLSANATASGAATISCKVAADTNLDMFAFNDGGVLKLEMAAWTSATTRAAALAIQDGVYVKSGAPSRRYLGSVRTTATDGQTEFTPKPAGAAGGSHPKLLVWNAQHRHPVAALCRDSTNSWNYTTATLREANGSTNNRISFVNGLAEGGVNCVFSVRADNTSADIYRICAIGYDSTTAIADGALTGQSEGQAGRPGPQLIASFSRQCDIGFHFVQELEYSAATGTTSWKGVGGSPLLQQNGMWLHGEF